MMPGSLKLQYWELTDELCQLLGVSRAKLLDILVRQGVNSLGKFTLTLPPIKFLVWTLPSMNLDTSIVADSVSVKNQ